MEAINAHWQALADLDARHDELLARLEDLDRRVERVLKAHLAAEGDNASPGLEGAQGLPGPDHPSIPPGNRQ